MSHEVCRLPLYTKYETNGIPASMIEMFVGKEVTLVEDRRFHQL
jgi:hypothetical protein